MLALRGASNGGRESDLGGNHLRVGHAPEDDRAFPGLPGCQASRRGQSALNDRGNQSEEWEYAQFEEAEVRSPARRGRRADYQRNRHRPGAGVVLDVQNRGRSPVRATNAKAQLSPSADSMHSSVMKTSPCTAQTNWNATGYVRAAAEASECGIPPGIGPA